MGDLLNQILPPIILIGDFNVHNASWESKKTNTSEQMIEQILDKFNLLYFNKKKKHTKEQIVAANQ